MPAAPRRLFFVNRYYWPDESATAQMLTDLAEALAKEPGIGGKVFPPYDVTVITSRQRLDDPHALLPARESRKGVEIYRLWTSRFGRQNLLGRACDYLSFYFSAALMVLGKVQRGDTVVAKTDPPLLGAVLAPFVWLKYARLLNWWQDVYPEIAVRLGVLRERGVFTRLLTSLRNASLRRAAHNVVVGDRMRQYLADTEPGNAPFTVIPNWCADLSFTPTPAPGNSYRRELGLAGKVVFAYSGNLGRAHAFEPLLQAAERLRARTDLHFLIIGGGAQRDAVQRDAQTRGLTNWSFLPYQPREKLADSLGAADVHLVTLDPAMEGLIVPSKLYGILAAGRPVLFIGAPDGEVARVIEQHGCGLTAPPDQPGKLEEIILRLAANPDVRRDLGARARAAFESEYTLPHAVRRWEQLLL